MYVEVEVYVTNELEEVSLTDLKESTTDNGLRSLDSTRSYVEEMNTSQIYKQPGRIKNKRILSSLYELILEDGRKV